MKRHGSMNHIYRLVWSQVTNTWVAVAETARGRGKGSGRQRKKLVAAALALTAVTFASPYAQAGPTGGQVVSGAGTITQTGTLTTIKQNSQNLSLNWSTFNIAPQETVDFVQPSTNSVAVNRIFDTNGTSILGHLNANGQVYLINPNGIVFGAGAQVNVGGLVASTLDLSNSSGTARTFSGSGTGSVVNQGTINAASGGSVALLGNHVSNQGTITAQLGAVALGAGNAVTLTFNGNDLVHMQVNQSVLNSLAENGGLIRADGGTVVMNAGAANALLASVVNNTGVIEARTVNQQEGSITLLGGMTAGTTNVGGTLDASAPNGGNGGSVTTNAANVIIGNDAKVTTASTSGLAGSWLIDPTNFTISAGSGVQTTSGIGATTLQTNLGLGNVSITTSAAANGSDLGDINVNAPVTWSANKLTLTAAHDVDINAVMTANNTAALTLTPGGNVNVGFNSAGGFSGQVNFFAADGTTPRSGTGFLTINGIGYTVLTSLSALQGMGTSGNYALGTDITGGSFTPIGTNGEPFTGHFDGLGHTISGLIPTTEASTGTGLFGSLSGVVQNVGLVGGSVTVNGSNYTGSLVGANYGTIRNSYSSATVTASNNSIFVGGLVGYQYGGTITNSYASGTVAGGSNSTYVGGLVGNNVGGTISTSHAIGSVTGSSYNVGGLVGQNKGGTISNSYATGNVSGSTNVGGLVGFSQASGAANSTISNSYATGSVSGTVGVGGLVGANYGSTYGAFTSTISNSYATGGTVNGTSEVGGLVGINAGNYGGGTISNSYSTGAITGTTHVGGLVGTNTANTANPNNSVTYTGTVSNSFWDTTTSGQSSSAGGKGMSTSNMQTQANFTSSTTANGSVNPGWNFATSWVMYSGTYPLLTAFLTPLTITANNVSTTYTGLTYSGAGEGVTYSVTPNLSFLSGSASYSGNSQSAVNVSGSPYVITPGGFSSTSQQGYLITYVNGSLTVTPAPLTVTGLSGTGRAYNGSTVDALTGTGVLSGLMNSETLTLSNAASGTLASANAGSEAVTTALGLVSGTGLASNYSLTQPTLANVTITQAPLTVTGLSGTGRTYNGSTVDALTGTGVLSGLVNSETLTLSNAASGTLASANAGSEAVTAALGLVSGTGLAANYSLTQPTLANVTITQAPLTVTGLSGTGRAYNGSTVDALTGTGVLSGLVNSETLTLSNAASGTLASANAGSEAVTTALGLVSGTGLAANYSLTQPTLPNVTITQAPLTVTGLSGTGRTYNGSTVDALTGTGVLSGLVNSETLTLSNAASGTLASANAGSEAVTAALGLVSGTGLAANYSLTQPTLANVTITQAPLTVTGFSGTGRTYNGSTADALSGTGVLSGLVNSETLTLSNAASGTLASANAGSEAVTSALGLVSGTGLAANYSLTQPTLANVTITQAPLTVTGLSGTGRAYNGSTVDALSGTGVLSGLVNSETLTLSNAASGTLASANAGSEAVTAALGLVSGTGLAANYSLTQPTLANVTITQAPLTVTGLSGTGRTYNGSTVDALTGTGVLSGLVNSETLTLSNVASGTLASANAGSEAVTTALGLVSGTGLAANYSLTQPTLANVTITQAPLTVSTGNVTKTYDGGLTALGSASVTSGALFSTDTLSGGSFAFTNPNAGNGNKTVTVSGVTVNDGNSGGNYDVTYANNSTSTINQAPLTVTGLAGTGRAYNGSTVDALSGTAVLSGLVNSETLTLSNAASGTLASANAGSEAVTTALGLVSGTGLAANYSLTQPTLANVTITQAPLTISTSNVTKTYDGGLTALGSASVTSGALFSTDTLSGGSFAFTNPNAGNGNKTVTVSGVTVNDGNSGGNYDVTYANNTTSTINQAPLTVTGLAGTGRSYNGSTVDALTGTAVLSGLVNSETLTTGGSGTLASANAGSEAVSAAVVLVNGTGLASNYSLTQPTLANVTITQAPLTVTGLSGTGRVYNGSTVDALSGTGVLSGLVNSETLTLINAASGTLASANAGSEAVTAALGLVSGTGLAANYSLTQPTLSNVTITQAPLTVTGLSGTGRTYNGSTVDALTGTGVLSGLVNSETLTLSNAASGTLASANAGSEAVTAALGLVSGTGLAANYSLTQPTLPNVTITQAPLTVTGLSGTGRAYDGSTVDALSGTGVLSGLVNSETLTLSNAASGTLASANAGSEAVTAALGLVSGTGLAANYSLTQPTLANVTITQAPLTVTGLSGTGRTYNGSTVDALTGTGVLSGLVNSETLTLSNAASGTLASANAGSEAVTAALGLVSGTGLAANYSLTQPTLANVTITQAPLTVTGLSGTGRVYNGSTVDALSGTGVLSGLVNSETLTLSNAATGTLASANAGSEAVTTALGLVSGTGLAANYSLTQPTLANVTITQAPLTVTGLSGTGRAYNGSTVDALSGTGVLSGLVNSETLTLSNAASGTLASANAGSESVTAALGLVSGTGLAANYSLTQPTLANVTIAPAPLTVTLTNSGVSKTYNGNVNAPTGFTPTYSFSGLIAGDTGATVTDTTASYNSAHVVSANELTVSGLSLSGVIGSNGSLANDYTLIANSANVAATITAAPLTASAAIAGTTTKVFDGTTAATGATVSGSITSAAIAGDTLALNTSGISLNYNSSQTNASTISATGSASLSIASSDSGSLTSDYALTQPVIAPVAGTITAASTPIPPTPPTTTPAPTIPSPVLIVFQPSTQPVAAPSLPSTGEQQLTAGANNNFDANPAAGVYPAAGASSVVGANTADGTSPAVNANSTSPAGVVVNTTINIAPGVELHLVKGGVRLPDNLVSVN